MLRVHRISWLWAKRSRVEPRLALRPTVPAEARSTPTERTNATRSRANGNEIDRGASSRRPRSVHRSGSRPGADPFRVARAPEHVTAGALRASVPRTRSTDLRARTRARAG